MNFEHRSQLLKPTDKAQSEMVIGGISEVLHKVAEGKDSVLALPGPDTCFEATGQYGIDGVTEKVNFRKSIAIELHFIFYKDYKMFHNHYHITFSATSICRKEGRRYAYICSTIH